MQPKVMNRRCPTQETANHLERGKAAGQKGQALVEFLVGLFTFLFFLFGVLQLALCLNAQTLVRYAAFNAARAAVVHGADKQKMLQAARLSLVSIFPDHGRADTVLGLTQNYYGAEQVDQRTDWLELNNKPITSVSLVNVRQLSEGERVPFDDPPSASKAVITVRVQHQYELVVPLVNALIHRMWKLAASSRSSQTLDELAHDAAKERKKQDLSKNSGYRIPLVAYYTMRMQSDFTYSRR